MIVRLFCPVCTNDARLQGLPFVEIDVAMPIVQLTDDGRYETKCEAGHIGTVYLDNVKFELLFEMGLSALVDGYPKEAVTSFAASLERFFEFYWRVVMAKLSVPADEVTAAWKALAKQSERQLGAFVAAHLALTGKAPQLLSYGEINFRNEVIHRGYLPKHTEAVKFGDKIMVLINSALDDLRKLGGEAVTLTYDSLSPRPKDKTEDLRGVINVITAVDVRHPIKDEKDDRRGGVENQFARIERERTPHRLTLLTRDELKKRRPEIEPPREE